MNWQKPTTFTLWSLLEALWKPQRYHNCVLFSEIENEWTFTVASCPNLDVYRAVRFHNELYSQLGQSGRFNLHSRLQCEIEMLNLRKHSKGQVFNSTICCRVFCAFSRGNFYSKRYLPTDVVLHCTSPDILAKRQCHKQILE